MTHLRLSLCCCSALKEQPDARLAVEAALKRLIQEGFYRRVELEEALAMVAKAAWELPNSMVSLLMGAPPSTLPAARSALRSLLLSSAEP